MTYTKYNNKRNDHYSKMYDEYMKETERHERRARRKRAIERRVRRSMIITFVFLIIGSIAAYDLISNWEQHYKPARDTLRESIMNGDPEAISFYRDNYIHRDKYLYDEPFTLELMADRYTLDAKALEAEFEASGYTHLQDFYDEVLKDKV